MDDTQENRKLTAYLLGELPEAEEQALENRYLEDEELFEQLKVAETELVDAYVGGELGAVECRRLEARFLQSPRGRQKLQFANDLESAVRAHRRIATPTQTVVAGPWVRQRYVFAVAAAFLIGVVVLAWWNNRQPSEPSPATTQLAHVRSTGANGPAKEPSSAMSESAGRPRPAQPGAGVVALSLAPGLLRDAGPSVTLALPAGTRQVRITARLETRIHGTCRALLTTVEGREIWRIDGIGPREGNPTTLGIEVPADVFNRGDYILTVESKSGGRFEAIADYYFRVSRN